MLIFQDNYAYKDPLNIVFLCGSHYSPQNKRDKRKILKKHIDNSAQNRRAIILEENFQFRKTNKQYLSYDTIYLSGLAQIEQLASLYANKIIILHETISTAAELGMFAINPALAHKICLLVPDDISIEEDKISGFIKLAFLKKEAPETKVTVIRYYPDVEIRRTSPNKSDYHSFFHDNEIGAFLGQKLDDFLTDTNAPQKTHFMKNRYATASQDPNIIDYSVIHKAKTIKVSIHIDQLKIQLLAILGVDSIRKQLRTESELRDHVSFLYTTYRNILRNTVEILSGLNIHDYKVSVSLKESHCSLKQAVGYFLYMLQAVGLISLIQRNSDTPTIRKVQFSTAMDHYSSSIRDIIVDTTTTEFGRLVT